MSGGSTTTTIGPTAVWGSGPRPNSGSGRTLNPDRTSSSAALPTVVVNRIAQRTHVRGQNGDATGQLLSRGATHFGR